MNRCILLNLSHRSGVRMSPQSASLLCIPADVIPISALLRTPEPVGNGRLNKGALVETRVFSWFRRTVILKFGYVFYNDMKKKPVAQAECQHYLLENTSVYGLLSRLRIAIVVNCFTLVNKI